MSATVLAQTPPAVQCPDCGETVLRSGDLLLDAEACAGGLYEIGPALRRRRSLLHIAAEHRARRAIHGGGHDPHDCPRPNWYE